MSLRNFCGPLRGLRTFQLPSTVIARSFYSTDAPKPLRILFCGSDEFSSASLRAVFEEKTRNPELIASIDVLCRPGKLSGRGMKSIREVPIKKVAQELGLQIHERDTFTGWKLPLVDGEPISLIIAVSFGLFVPKRILNSTEYGGVNVHPSLLPDFRGPAPLHHALLQGDSYTGVTLQSLDTEKFDHGKILAQEGFSIPYSSRCTYPQLLDLVTPKAAEILVKGLRKRAFVPGYASNDIPEYLTRKQNSIRHAPKITTEDRRIDFATMSSEEIERKDRVLGRVWFNILPSPVVKKIAWFAVRRVGQSSEGFKRLVCHDVSATDLSTRLSAEQRRTSQSIMSVGPFKIIGLKAKRAFSWNERERTAKTFAVEKHGDAVVIPVGSYSQSNPLDAVRIGEVTVEGGNKMKAAKFFFEVFEDTVKVENSGGEESHETNGNRGQSDEKGKQLKGGDNSKWAFRGNEWKYGLAIGFIISLFPLHIPIVHDLLYFLFPWLDKRPEPTTIPKAPSQNLDTSK